MKPILLAALILTTFLFALAGCAAEEPAENQLSFADGAENRALQRETLEAPSQPQATPAMMMETDSQGLAPAGDVKVEPSIPSQERIIVHTAYLSLVTDDVALTIGRVGDLAGQLGGWVVNSERSSRHSGSVAVRVPAASLDEALRLIGEMAEVEARAITSQDVTDEYVDSQSRLVSMRATEQRCCPSLNSRTAWRTPC